MSYKFFYCCGSLVFDFSMRYKSAAIPMTQVRVLSFAFLLQNFPSHFFTSEKPAELNFWLFVTHVRMVERLVAILVGSPVLTIALH